MARKVCIGSIVRLIVLSLFVVCSGLGSAPASSQAAAPDVSPARALENAFVSVADQVEPAVVTVIARRTTRTTNLSENTAAAGRTAEPAVVRSESTGSGVFITPDGWVMTNDHVVSRAQQVTVRLHDGREFEGRVVRDYTSDIALVKLDGTGFPAARLGDSDKVKVGQWAIAIGSPYRYEGSFSVGVVSALHRRQVVPDKSGEGPGRVYPDMIQTDAAINPGNSGGPLVNLEGEIIGINSALENDEGRPVGIGFAVPANLAKYVAEQLRTNGRMRYGYLGVSLGTVTPRIASCYGVAGGALVSEEPQAGTPAAKAGVHVDDVIGAVDGRPVHDEPDLRLALLRSAPGSTVTLSVSRNGVAVSLKATLGEAPDPARTSVPAPLRRGTGLDVAVLTSDCAEHAGLNSGDEGVVVRSCDRASPVGQSELQPGDVVLRVNGTPVRSVDAFREMDAALAPGSAVRLVWQGKRGLTFVRRVAVVVLD